VSKLSLSDRFWSKVDKIDDKDSCWIWKGARNIWGNGVIQVNRKTRSVRFVSYEMHFGVRTNNRRVYNKCKNPLCVRPDHLLVSPRVRPICRGTKHEIIGKNILEYRKKFNIGNDVKIIGSLCGIELDGAMLMFSAKTIGIIENAISKKLIKTLAIKYKTFKETILCKRINLRMSTSDVAKLIGVKRQCIDNWERCSQYPNDNNMIKLSKVLNLDLDKLMSLKYKGK
jgi:DNA-binding XRE family transcriptional regulator